MSDGPRRIRDMRNLGPAIERMLTEVGIATPDALRAAGAAEAFRRLTGRGGASRNALHAMEGALGDRDWRDVARDDVRVVAGERRHAEACAAILDGWIEETAWMPRLHDLESIRWFVGEVLLGGQHVWVAFERARPVGFIALEAAPGEDGSAPVVSALYLAPDARGRGIGRRLLEEAKRAAPGGLELWTFQANEDARRFYAREGFTERRRTDGENEERLPDVLMGWR